MSKTMLEAGWSLNLGSMLYLEGWSSTPKHLNGVALLIYFWYAHKMKQLPALKPALKRYD